MLALAALLAAATIPVSSRSPEALEAFQRGREFMDSSRAPLAQKELQRALELDPGFAQARSYLGLATPGAPGLKLAKEATEGDGALPEVERLLVEANYARKSGNGEKERELWRRIAQLAPDDWRSQFMLGRIAGFDHRSTAAIVALKRALQLNPKAAVIYNALGYAYAETGDLPSAITALHKYVELAPEDGNPPDSLAEVYLWSGNLAEAERWFTRSTQLDPTQWMGFIGIAQVRFLRGDWAAGRKAGEQAVAAATRSHEKQQAQRYLAWSYMAEGKPAEALKAIGRMEEEAHAARASLPWAMAAVQRARMLDETGEYAAAAKQAEIALQRSTAADVPGEDRAVVRMHALPVLVWSWAKLGNSSEAARVAKDLQAELATAPSNTELRSSIHFAEGALALARHKPAEAAAQFGQCGNQDYYCRFQLYLAQKEAGLPAAQETRAKLLSQKRRDQIYVDQDPMYLYVFSRLQGG